MIILASSSPRRKQLLKKVVKEFEIDVSNIEESYPKYLAAKRIPEYLAIKKTNDVFKRHPEDVVIGADTIVICNHQILGKPKDKQDVKRMIKMLQGNKHLVVTGMCIKSKDVNISFSAITKVYFRKMSRQEIEDYCSLETVYDKAGAYAIQAEAKKYIYHIIGEYDNVVGLPTKKLSRKLKEYKIKNN